MAWLERVDKRAETNRTWQDGNRFAISATMSPLHYESVVDSGLHDAEVDLTPQRVNVAAFDGWRVTQNAWHYALGKDLAGHGDQDGWVGFGGRGGRHWFKFRLARVGYLHWPTRAWDDIGGPPTYDRANLSRETYAKTIGPDGAQDTINVAASATWESIWATPGGGRLDVEWHPCGSRLKELLTINQAGREWVAANRPPTTPAAETWFGFVFELDWSDIPKVVRAGVLQDIDGDFADDGVGIELSDALDRLLGFMPISGAWVEDHEDEAFQLRKRFWKDGTDHYLLVGARCDVLDSLPAGNLIFDPTIDKSQIPSWGDDAYFGVAYSANASFTLVGTYLGYMDYHSYFKWNGFTIPDGATIDVSYAKFYMYIIENFPMTRIYGVDEENPSWAENNTYCQTRSNTSNSIYIQGNMGSGWYTTASLNAIIQELADSYTHSNDAMALMWKDVRTSGGAWDRYYIRSYDYGAAYSAEIHIEYTEASVPVPILDHHYRQMRS